MDFRDRNDMGSKNHSTPKTSILLNQATLSGTPSKSNLNIKA